MHHVQSVTSGRPLAAVTPESAMKSCGRLSLAAWAPLWALKAKAGLLRGVDGQVR